MSQISDLVQATVLDDADEVLLRQGGVDKRLSGSAIIAKTDLRYDRVMTLAEAIAATDLVEGNSVRATSRMTGAAKGTVLKLLSDVGKACSDYQNKALRNLSCKKIQCDEIWAFCYSKNKNVPES